MGRVLRRQSRARGGIRAGGFGRKCYWRLRAARLGEARRRHGVHCHRRADVDGQVLDMIYKINRIFKIESGTIMPIL